jgi:demethylmenaquinone methyltransferase/2-methoxy-6-polyprenyl-1,4-benzoquinol methylase
VNHLLDEQRRYYAARAPEYEDWWYRRGAFELDADAKAAWDADIAEVAQALAPLVHGSVLELAAGTGIWTRQLAQRAARVVAVDVNPETLALNTAPAEHVVADIFEWRPTEQFDLCFFGFWLSHVPEELLDSFWSLVRSALRPGGRVFLIDNAPRTNDGTSLRQVADGREFRIVKVYRTPDELPQLDLRITANGNFMYGGGVL